MVCIWHLHRAALKCYLSRWHAGLKWASGKYTNTTVHAANFEIEKTRLVGLFVL